MSVDHIAYTVMLEMLLDPKGATAARIVQETGLHRHTVRRRLADWHNRPKPLIYVLKWVKGKNGHWYEVWAMGLMVDDAPHPGPVLRIESRRALDERKRIASGILPAQKKAEFSEACRQRTLHRPRDEKNRFIPIPIAQRSQP